MATKYHISPETGRPNICRAEIQCPIGGANEHYASKEDARAAYEKQMSGETFAAPVAKKKAGRPKKEVAPVEVETFETEDSYEDDFEGSDYGLPEDEPDFSGLSEELDIDDDWSDIKCDDCGYTLDNCICGQCEYCGAEEGDEHYEDCPNFKFKPKAYSWE